MEKNNMAAKFSVCCVFIKLRSRKIEECETAVESKGRKNILMPIILYMVYNAMHIDFSRHPTRDGHYDDDVAADVPNRPVSLFLSFGWSRYCASLTHCFSSAYRECLSSFLLTNLQSRTSESSSAKFSGRLKEYPFKGLISVMMLRPKSREPSFSRTTKSLLTGMSKMVK
jgi:hypothetical protein